ncbi:MAG: hypothetical protein E6772_07380 [Dysgonomonas sp.]|nr:hypothetical protein [Dysgonomonas sp.]
MKTIMFSSLEQILSKPTNLRSANGAPTPHDTYVMNYTEVCNYVSAVNQSKLPVLKKPPTHWNEYEKCLINAKAAAIEWVNEIAARLKALPAELINADEDMLKLFNSAIDQCNYLIKDPTDEHARKKLKKNIDNSLEDIKDLIEKLDSIIKRMSNFRDTLPEQARNLQRIADLAMQDEKVDQKKIKELTEKVNDMNNEISDLTAAIVGLSIAAGIGITLSVIAVAAAGPIGMLTWIFTGAAVATAVTFIAIDAVKIKNLKAEIESLQSSMNDYSADVAALQLTSQTFGELAKKAKAVENNMKYILDIWKALQYDLSSISKEIEKSGEKYKSEDWKAVKSSFEKVIQLWNQFQKEVQLCNLNDMKGNTAKLEPGMSSAEVEKALKNGQDVELIKYLTA